MKVKEKFKTNNKTTNSKGKKVSRWAANKQFASREGYKGEFSSSSNCSEGCTEGSFVFVAPCASHTEQQLHAPCLSSCLQK